MPRLNLKQRKEVNAFIKNHHGAMTLKEMSAQVNVSVTTIAKMIIDLGLKSPRRRHPIQIVQGNIFNVHAKRNWLAG